MSDDIALPKLSVACTAGGASGEVAGILDDDPMCMHTTVRLDDVVVDADDLREVGAGAHRLRVSHPI